MSDNSRVGYTFCGARRRNKPNSIDRLCVVQCCTGADVLVRQVSNIGGIMKRYNPQLSRDGSKLIVQRLKSENPALYNLKTKDIQAFFYPGSRILYVHNSNDIFVFDEENIEVWSNMPSDYEMICVQDNEGMSHAIEEQELLPSLVLSKGSPHILLSLISSYLSPTEQHRILGHVPSGSLPAQGSSSSSSSSGSK